MYLTKLLLSRKKNAEIELSSTPGVKEQRSDIEL
jgi:hypothetical protein